MTLQEFSTTFDVLWANITSNQAPGINEYEKSVFLTKAQSQLVNEFFNNRTDGFGGGFDGSQRRQYDFSGLIRTEELFNVNTYKERISPSEKLDRRSKVYLFPQNYFLAVSELLFDKKWQYSVVPLSYTEYQRLMTKPYNFPPKRMAWRLFTDKKNCNVWEGVVDVNGDIQVSSPNTDDSSNDSLERAALTNVTYKFQSSWADKKRNLEVQIINNTANWQASDQSEEPVVTGNGDTLKFKYDEGRYGKIYAECNWKDNNMTYTVRLVVSTNYNKSDDEYIGNILKAGFTYLKDMSDVSKDSDIYKAMVHTDGFSMADFPSRFTWFGSPTDASTTGNTFTTHVVPLPIAEIVGKFANEPTYKLRYVKTLTPIILEDLTNYGTDLTIDGLTAATECALPAETHQEILERAVTLAKIAWQGGTLTQAQAQQRDNRD